MSADEEEEDEGWTRPTKPAGDPSVPKSAGEADTRSEDGETLHDGV